MDKRVKYSIYVCVGLLAAGALLGLSIAMNSSSQISSELTQYAPSATDSAAVQMSGSAGTQAADSQQSTLASGSEVSGTAQVSATGSAGTQASGTAASAAQPSGQSTPPAQMTDEQLLAAAEAAVNGVKKAQDITAVKKQTVAIKLTDCSVPSLTDAINAIIKKIAQDNTTTFEFKSGTATVSGESVTPDQAIPPTSRSFELDPQGVKSVKYESVGGSTVYTIVLKEESTTLASPVPQWRSKCMDYLNLADYDLGAVTITNADILYEEATVTVTVDSSGRLTGYRELMPISGTGEGSLVLAVSGTLDGYLDEEWSISYN